VAGKPEKQRILLYLLTSYARFKQIYAAKIYMLNSRRYSAVSAIYNQSNLSNFVSLDSNYILNCY